MTEQEYQRLDRQRAELALMRHHVERTADIFRKMVVTMFGGFKVVDNGKIDFHGFEAAVNEAVDDALSPLLDPLRTEIEEIDERMSLHEQRELQRDYERGLI